MDRPEIDDGKLYLTHEVAEMARLDVSYIRRLLLLKDQPFIKGQKLGRVWTVKGADLRRWLDSREA
ncbi:MAG: hypothetical protein ACYTEQ_19170 [Planctomycetota bacterium]|jgi:hypothetical protein